MPWVHFKHLVVLMMSRLCTMWIHARSLSGSVIQMTRLLPLSKPRVKCWVSQMPIAE